MKHINTGKAEILLVKVPEQATDFEIVSSITDTIALMWDEEGNDHPYVYISTGNWKVLGSAWDLTEEQWKEILNEGAIDLYETAGVDAVYTGIDMLKAFGIYQVNPYGNYSQAIIDKVSYSEWEEAEANTGNWIVLIKVKE